MAANHPPGARTRPPSINKNAAAPRTPRAIRFSESEWDRVRIAAAKRGISFGSFVREAALGRAAEDFGDNSTALPPGIVDLIKHTYRYAFIFSTMKREEFVKNGRRQEVDEVVELARRAQAKVLSGA